jgi:glycosyltransferase involved in cell wall biosynthesis
MKRVTTMMLVKDPPLERLAALIECLRPISDEFVIVVDSKTKPEYTQVMMTWDGVVLVPFEWVDDFSAARNAGLPYVTRPWTLVLDPDELPSFNLMKAIDWATMEVNDSNASVGYMFWTLNFWGGLLGAPEEYHWHIRLWRSGHGRFYRKVHELVEIDGNSESMTRDITVRRMPKDAPLIHSKAADVLFTDQAYYESLGERSM